MKRWFFALFGVLLFAGAPVYAQNPNEAFLPGEGEELFGEDFAEGSLPKVESFEVKAQIVNIVDDREIGGQRQVKFIAEADGAQYTVDTAEALVEGLRYNISVGDSVYLQVILQDGEPVQVFLVDIVRIPALLFIALLFGALIVLIGYQRGLLAILGLLATLAIIFFFLLPSILAGANPISMTIIASAVILGVNMHLAHGVNKSTALAYLSTLIGLALAAFFAWLFTGLASLSGLASEETVLLYFEAQEFVIPRGILLAGMILGAVGVLDDIAITQAETVTELREVNGNLEDKDIYQRAMRIGRHHIASVVNTLVLAYVGVALPLFLLFLLNDDITMLRFLNEELVAEEFVRTIAGTMALILTVPISTFLATRFNKR
ncbi:MAG: YibE/F family protein [bacterium]|nr:YibE/F family protein [bacterium]